MGILDKWSSIWNNVWYKWDLNNCHTIWQFVIDVSHWTTNKNQFSLDQFKEFAEARKLKALIFKLSDSYNGDLFYDDLAEFWYNIGEETDLPTTGYHWLQPGVDPTVAWRFHEAWLKDHPVKLPNVVDFEEKNIISATDALWRLKTFLEYSGPESLIYTGAGYMAEHIVNKIPSSSRAQKVGWMSNYPLWLAYYSRYYPPTVYPWTTHQMVGWQYSPNADYPYYKDGDDLDGTFWGVDSRGGDVNWFTTEFLNKYIGDTQNEQELPQDPVETPIEEPQVGKTYKSLSGMNIRSSPEVANNVVGYLPSNTEVVSLGEGYEGVWIKIADNKWVCKNRMGKTYLTEVMND